MRSFLFVFTLAASAAALSGADTAAGQAAYDKSCKSCHGPDGTPNAAVAKMMKVDMKDLKSADVQAMSDDDDLKKVITEGKGKMKPQSAAAGSAADLVAYMRTWKK